MSQGISPSLQDSTLPNKRLIFLKLKPPEKTVVPLWSTAKIGPVFGIEPATEWRIRPLF